MNKKFAIWAVILLMAAALRFYQLGIVPKGITNDELGYFINAYSIAHTGKNIFGQWFPIFTYFGPGFPFMPVPTYLQALLFLVLPLSPFTGRILNALLGVASVYLVGVLAKKLTGKNTIAYGSAFALAISPWHIFFTRTGYDAVVASFFYLMFLVWSVSHKKNSFWPFVWLILALFSYRGMTPIAGGLVPLVAWYKKSWRLFIISMCAVAVFLGVAVSQRPQGFITEGESIGQASQNIELEMRKTQGPQTIKRLFLNKPAVLFSQFAEKYVAGYDAAVLFLHGEGSQTYSMWMRGRWYIVDGIMMLLGFFLLAQSPFSSVGIFAICLFLVAGIPGMVGGAPYGSRNLFMVIPAAILVGSGWSYILKAKKFRMIIAALFILCYAYLVSHFLFDYFARYADQRSEVWFASMKDVHTVIAGAAGKSVVWANASFFDFLQFAPYEKMSPHDIQAAWRTHAGGQLTWKNIRIEERCDPEYLKTFTPDKPVFILRDGCWKDMQSTKRINDYYGNAVWHIYETL